MEMNNKKSIAILNKLIGINNDRIEVHEAALKETKEPDLIKLFTQFVVSGDECNSELADEVEKMGGTPVETTRTFRKFFKSWMDFQAALLGAGPKTVRDRKTILDSCEYIEEVTVNSYEKVLGTCAEDLNVEQLSMVRDQCAWLKADYNTVKAIRYLLVELVESEW